MPQPLEWRSTGTKLRVLDFDCEARPLSWIGGDFVSKEITAIAAKFIGEKGRTHVWILGDCGVTEMLEGFRELYDEADMVAGHHIRGFDLPTVNAMMGENNLPKLGAKLAHDTCKDLTRWSGISKSQESIADMLGVKAPKVQMSQAKWRSANRLHPESFALTYKRVVGDVLQNIELRQRLIELRYLKPPKVWAG